MSALRPLQPDMLPKGLFKSRHWPKAVRDGQAVLPDAYRSGQGSQIVPLRRYPFQNMLANADRLVLLINDNDVGKRTSTYRVDLLHCVVQPNVVIDIDGFQEA
jgi:hypothetical protein